MKRTSAIGLVVGMATAGLALVAPSNAYAKPYKGGEIFSSQAYLYGRMEMRMRMARGSGILSTFFTYKDGSEIEGTFWEEIDIEVFGKDDATTWQSNIITGVGTRSTSEGDHEHHTSLADDYHTYALEWTPEYVAWELDGVEVRRTTGGQVGDLTNPQSLRFNLWAANIESWVGPFDTGALPQYQYVNWIRYYRYEGGQFVHEWTDEFDSFDTARWGRADWTFGENLVDFDPNNVVVEDGTLVLALTVEGQTGFNGTVPVDSGDTSQGNTTDGDDTAADTDTTGGGDTSQDPDPSADTTGDDTPTTDTSDGANSTSDGTPTSGTSDSGDTTAVADTSSESEPAPSTDTTPTSTTGNTTQNTDTSGGSSTTTSNNTSAVVNPEASTGGSPDSDSTVTSTNGSGNTQATGSSTLPDTTGGPAAPTASSDNDPAGCACRLTPTPTSGHAAWSLLGLGLAWWLRRRTQRPRPTPPSAQ